MNTFGWLYFGMGLLTMILAAVAEWRKGAPWSEAWWWLVLWPVGLMWPLMIWDLPGEIIDGPYRPQHRLTYY